VLFADLKGSMELLASRDPEEARKLIERDPDVGGSAHPASCNCVTCDKVCE
jgi:hypothetical protein